VRDVSLHIHASETYGLVGESGSGKTTLVLAVMRHLSERGLICSGRVLLSGQDLLELNPEEMRQVWGRQITLVPQNPQSALNPSMRVGEQLAEILRYQKGLDCQRPPGSLRLVRKVHWQTQRESQPPPPDQRRMQQRVLIRR
jgi:peptide/nickel transport system ATP-binding protein